MHRPRWSIAILLVAWLQIGASPACAEVVFSDDVFDPAHYEVQTAGSGSSTPMQLLAGGNPDEHLVIQNRPTPSAGQTIRGWHLNIGFVHDPATSGAIDSITWQVDFENRTTGQNVGLGLVQDGALFMADTFITTGSGPGWVHRDGAVLIESDFPGADFSNQGAPITLGLFTANTFDPGAGDVSNDVAFDNLVITLSTEVGLPAVPGLGGVGFALSAIALLGAALCFSLRGHRHPHSKSQV